MTHEAMPANGELAGGPNLGAGLGEQVLAIIGALADLDLEGGNIVIHPTATGGLDVEKAPSVSIVDRAPAFFAHNEQE